MPNLEDVVRYEIRKNSDKIHNIKKAAIAESQYGFNYINPRNTNWDEYMALKRDVSIWLAARRIQKTGTPDSAMAHNVDPKAAQKRLDRTAKKLKKNPRQFQHVDAWVAMKELSHAS